MTFIVASHSLTGDVIRIRVSQGIVVRSRELVAHVFVVGDLGPSDILSRVLSTWLHDPPALARVGCEFEQARRYRRRQDVLPCARLAADENGRFPVHPALADLRLVRGLIQVVALESLQSGQIGRVGVEVQLAGACERQAFFADGASQCGHSLGHRPAAAAARAAAWAASIHELREVEVREHFVAWIQVLRHPTHRLGSTSRE